MMYLFIKRLVVLIICFIPIYGISQMSNLRYKFIKSTSDTIRLDSLSIYPNSFKLKCNGNIIPRDEYKLDYVSSTLTLFNKCQGDLIVEYRVLPINLSKVYAKRDTSSIYIKNKGFRDRFLISNSFTYTDFFGGSGLNKSGSISRGVSFGNNQDFGINSTLNLELSGQITPNLKLLASVSDNSLPIQPDGNTNTLREFDQVFIQLYNNRFKMIVGDFWLNKPTGYFMKYKKRAQGLTVDYKWNKDISKVWRTNISGALSKGKFQRQIIQGNEGNQGPYRLVGAENEPFIVVLSGSERVYIDGSLLERGQDYDYIINYNTSEVIFTTRNQITKDTRIVVEFQYSDQNYARSLLQSSTSYTSESFKFWFNAYSEQDLKNQPLQQDLTFDQKRQLSEIGDSLSLARISSIDFIGYFDNQNLYKLVDSLGLDSILVYTINPDSANYRVTFEYVGPNNGDYVFQGSNALGKVYKWVSPLAGVSQGDYIPSRLIITPKQRQMVNVGTEFFLGRFITLNTEVSYSKNDLNTFSNYDSKDDHGYSGIMRFRGEIPLSKEGVFNWVLFANSGLEFRERNFKPIENYRLVEFDRDWNTRNNGYIGNEILSNLAFDFRQKEYGNINLEAKHYKIGDDYEGLRTNFNSKWCQKGFKGKIDASYLSSNNTTNLNKFIRHKIDFSQRIGFLTIGYKDDHEFNLYKSSIIEPTSYQFYDYQVYLSNSDSTKNHYRIFYRERYDKKSDTNRLSPVAKARSVGSEIKFTQWQDQKLNIITSYRELRISKPELISEEPENTILARLEHKMRIFKGALTLNTFYEVGSGLELRREFLYIQVNDGQGIYTWVDYNSDGIKDLNEFEVAQFVDQASYIRVFTPSNDYTKTFSNEYNQSIYWKPGRIWSSKKGVLKFLSRFANQSRIRINRKTNSFDGVDAFNPFFARISDTSLISTNSNLRNTLFFNRTSRIFGAEYTYQDIRNKTLLASGFDSRFNQFHEVAMRCNIKRKITFKLSVKIGEKISEVDYVTGRNYSIDYFFIEPRIIYQPNTLLTVTLDGRISDKQNLMQLGGELAKIYEVGSTVKYNQVQKGSIQGGLKMLNIQYNGNSNSALGFEMLEGLSSGLNYTWNIGYQMSISKNLQLSIQYNGRKSENIKIIHSGGMELRAFF